MIEQLYESLESAGLVKFATKTYAGAARVQVLFRFDNGLGASVIWSDGISYGADSYLWELAVIKYTTGDNYEIVYDRVLTDVAGNLTNDGVVRLLKSIKKSIP